MNAKDIDWGSQNYASEYLLSIADISILLSEQQDLINDAVRILFESWVQGGTVFVIGNGGSASTATHFCADMFKTVIESPGGKGIKALALSDNVPLVSALVNDWGWENLYKAQLETLMRKGDVVAAFSVHGGSGSDKAGKWSQNLLRALQFAKEMGGTTIGFSGFDGGAMKELCDVCIVVPADSTPAVESMHSVLAHLITFRLKHLINSKPEEGGAR